jgi:hypothetical protein
MQADPASATAWAATYLGWLTQLVLRLQGTSGMQTLGSDQSHPNIAPVGKMLDLRSPRSYRVSN